MANVSTFVKRFRNIMRKDAGINGDAQRIEQIAWMLFLKVYDTKEQDWELEDANYTSIIPELCRWQNWAHDDGSGHALTGPALLKFVDETLFPALKQLPVTAETPIKQAIVQATFEDTHNYMKDGVLLRQVLNIIDELDLSDYQESHAFGEVYESILKELQSAGSSGEFYTPRAVTDFIAQMIQPALGERMADFACGTGGFITSWLKELKKSVRTTADEKAYAHSIYGIEKKPFPYMLCVTNLLLHDVDVPQVFHGNSLTHDLLDYTEKDKFDVILMNPPYGGAEDESILQHFPDDLANSETADLFMGVIMYRLRKNGRAAVVLPDGFLFGTDGAKANLKKKLLTEFNLHTIVRLPGSVFSPYTDITTNILFFDATGPTEKTWFYRLDMPSDRKHFSKTKPMELAHFAPVIEWWNNRYEMEEDGFPKAKAYTALELAANDYDFGLCGFQEVAEEVLPSAELICQYHQKSEALNKTLKFHIESIVATISGQTATQSSKSSRICHLLDFFTHFPERLRKSLLQEAIQGKLVSQRPEEGTAKELYQQIQAEKQRLIAAGTIKKEKPLPSIEEKALPFDIPETWKWVRLDDLVCKNIKRGKSPVYTEESSIAVFSQKCNSKNNGIMLSLARHLDESKLSTYSKTDFLSPDDIVINSTGKGTLGRVGIFTSSDNPLGLRIVPDSHVTIIRSTTRVHPPYLYYCLKSQQSVLEKAGEGSTKQTELRPQFLRELLIPLPPFAEQQRIVAKIEELLTLCKSMQ